jgi:SsrA-binding protein
MGGILSNPTVKHHYHVLETFEAGVVLRGTEVKSLRAGRGQIREAFARVEQDELWLYNCHIDEYSFGNRQNHDPKARRKLLLHKSEIRKIFSYSTLKGHAVVPLDFHWNNGKVKVTIVVGKGKEEFDKRQDLKTREADMEVRRALHH